MNAPQPDRLSDDMATSLGHAVSAFGSLEEALKRAIFSLTRKGLGQDVSDAALGKWLERMEDVADDSLGTLIDSFLALLKPAKTDDHQALRKSLSEIRTDRNLLCHASWRPGKTSGYWHPTFINTKGEAYPGEMNSADIDHIYQQTLQIVTEVIKIMQSTGIKGELSGEIETDKAG